MKKILFIDHAIEQIKLRELDLKKIKEIIKNPQQKIADKEDPSRIIYQSLVSDKYEKEKIIRIVIEESEKYIKVITSYQSSNIKKYWRV